MKQTIVAIFLVILLILITNPFHFWMPSMMSIVVLVVVLITFGFYASFILNEKVVDEREDSHRMIAARFAYLFGSGVMIAGVVVQAYRGRVDGWLIAALVVMIVTKLIARGYTDVQY